MKKKDVDKQLRELLEQAFPNGIDVSKKKPSIDAAQTKARHLIEFLQRAGFIITSVDNKNRTVRVSLFIGNHLRRQGMMLEWDFSIDFIANSTRAEFVEFLAASVNGAYEQALTNAERYGFPR